MIVTVRFGDGSTEKAVTDDLTIEVGDVVTSSPAFSGTVVAKSYAVWNYGFMPFVIKI